MLHSFLFIISSLFLRSLRIFTTFVNYSSQYIPGHFMLVFLHISHLKFGFQLRLFVAVAILWTLRNILYSRGFLELLVLIKHETCLVYPDLMSAIFRFDSDGFIFFRLQLRCLIFLAHQGCFYVFWYLRGSSLCFDDFGRVLILLYFDVLDVALAVTHACWVDTADFVLALGVVGDWSVDEVFQFPVVTETRVLDVAADFTVLTFWGRRLIFVWFVSWSLLSAWRYPRFGVSICDLRRHQNFSVLTLVCCIQSEMLVWLASRSSILSVQFRIRLELGLLSCIQMSAFLLQLCSRIPLLSTSTFIGPNPLSLRQIQILSVRVGVEINFVQLLVLACLVVVSLLSPFHCSLCKFSGIQSLVE